MATVTVGKENSPPVYLYYEDHGSGSSVGTVASVDCWIEDFRTNIARNPVPTLILHGELRTHADQIDSELARLLS
jgi:hypothetical protein